MKISIYLALIIFVTLILAGFYLGSTYSSSLSNYIPPTPPVQTIQVTPTPDLTQTQDPKIFSCNIDSDCTSVTISGCGCTPEYAINKQYLSFWKSQYYPTPPICTLNMCLPSKVKAQCITNKCQLVKN